LAFARSALVLGFPRTYADTPSGGYLSFRISSPFPRVHSSLLDNPGLHQNRLHRRRSTQPWDFALGLTMHPRQRGHPPCPKFRSVSRRLVRVSKDRPFTVFKPRSPLPLPRRRGRFGERQPAALSFRLRGFSPPWRLTLPRPSPNFRRSSSLGVHDVSCSAPPHSPSRGPTLRSLAPRMQRTESTPKRLSSRAHVTCRVSPSVHRAPCPLVLGLPSDRFASDSRRFPVWASHDRRERSASLTQNSPSPSAACASARLLVQNKTLRVRRWRRFSLDRCQTAHLPTYPARLPQV
jgi:hypothetical protein